MKLSELTDYAEKKYQIPEQHKWADFPGFSVLADPRTGKWVALLMRQWDTETGTEVECCDLKCGKQSLLEFPRSYLAPPIRMRGSKWLSVSFDKRTEPELVFRLFDRAVSSGEQRGFTIVLDTDHISADAVYHDTALPFSNSSYQPPREAVPERLRQMRRIYEYGRETPEEKAKNFYRQGMLVQDYEDELPWSGDFSCYFPTYHDLTTRQLRGYFTWRAGVRRGEYAPVPASLAYLYLYELLNGIGCSSAEESLQKLIAFEGGYLDAGFGDASMRRNLRRWMLEFAVLQNIPPETARTYADPELLRKDAALSALQSPEDCPDGALFAALCLFGGAKYAGSPVIAADDARGVHLFCEAWRYAAKHANIEGKTLFSACFGEKKPQRWYPLANAVYWEKKRPADQYYELNACRSFRCRGGIWLTESYEKLSFDRRRLQGFLHETDLMLRKYLKTGHPLREKQEDAWAGPLIRAVIEEDRRAMAEAARPKLVLDLSGLERIRQDALTTRDSLLTEEEREELESAAQAAPPVSDATAAESRADLPLDALQIQILLALLQEGSAKEIIQSHHLMPSLVADAVNEALYDEIGDMVLNCEDDELALVEDYREDLWRMLGGKNE